MKLMLDAKTIKGEIRKGRERSMQHHFGFLARFQRIMDGREKNM